MRPQRPRAVALIGCLLLLASCGGGGSFPGSPYSAKAPGPGCGDNSPWTSANRTNGTTFSCDTTGFSIQMALAQSVFTPNAGAVQLNAPGGLPTAYTVQVTITMTSATVDNAFVIGTLQWGTGSVDIQSAFSGNIYDPGPKNTWKIGFGEINGTLFTSAATVKAQVNGGDRTIWIDGNQVDSETVQTFGPGHSLVLSAKYEADTYTGGPPNAVVTFTDFSYTPG